MDVIRARLDSSEAEKDRLRGELATAEMRLDRLNSRTVSSTQPKKRLEPGSDVKDEQPPSPPVSRLVNWWEF